MAAGGGQFGCWSVLVRLQGGGEGWGGTAGDVDIRVARALLLPQVIQHPGSRIQDWYQKTVDEMGAESHDS